MCQIDPDQVESKVESGLQTMIIPSSITCVDESLPPANHKEPRHRQSLISIPRKPSGRGVLFYMAVCHLEKSNLPFPYAMVRVSSSLKVTPSVAAQKLLEKRIRHAKTIPIDFVGDSAFSSVGFLEKLNSYRHTEGLPTIGATVSMKPVPQIASKVLFTDLKVNHYRCVPSSRVFFCFALTTPSGYILTEDLAPIGLV